MNPDQAMVRYLQGPGPHKLELGAGPYGKPGWLATDLQARESAAGVPIIALNATKNFPLPSDSFDFVYTEHMIEHISFDDGLNMLSECRRILKPGGVLRVVTPSLGFLFRIVSPDRSPFEERYRNWSITTIAPKAPAVTDALIFNNFMRAWGHTFIYDRETLRLALQIAGFEQVVERDLNESDHEPLRHLTNEHRIPSGFLALESMVMEATKGPQRSCLGKWGRNLALGKRATQSSVSTWSREDTPEKDASRLVSGYFTGYYNNHTGLDDPAWWQVDLEHLYSISLVRIVNRGGAPGLMSRASRFEIYTSDDAHIWKMAFRKQSDVLVSDSKYAPYVWVPEELELARFVRIQLIGKQYLHLDQVEIFGDEYNSSGAS